jgi:16S rRNA (cytosine967-C5)-methyltransferase
VKLSSLLGHTVEVSLLIDRDSRPADAVIDNFFRTHRYLGSHDRRFIAETVYGILRWKMLLDGIIAHAMVPELLLGRELFSSNLMTFRCCAYLLHAGTYSAEQLCAEFPDEARDPLRSLERHRSDCESDETTSREIALANSFPEWMVDTWIAQYGIDDAKLLCRALNESAPITLRVNTLKVTVEECRAALKREGIDTEPTRWSPFGLTLRRRINVFQLEAFRNGFFEVQDEGSQILALLVDPKPSAKVVDACAGAGGKTLALGAVMKNRGVIFALDVHTTRLDELRKRLKRSGLDTVRVKTIDGETLPDEMLAMADYVLVDAPCSGLGTMRRNPGMKWTVTPEVVGEISRKQSRILDLYSQCVKESGILVYATCTTMPEENELVVEGFLAAHPEFELEAPATRLARYNIASLAESKYFQLLPHRHNTDGFFAAVMKKKTVERQS